MDKDKRKSRDKEKDKPVDKIVDLNHYRKNKSEERRREYERVLFNRVLGVYSFAEKASLNHIEIVDMSASGIRFKEDRPELPLKMGQKVPLRFYFTPSSYLRVVVDVKRVTPFKEKERTVSSTVVSSIRTPSPMKSSSSSSPSCRNTPRSPVRMPILR